MKDAFVVEAVERLVFDVSLHTRKSKKVRSVERGVEGEVRTIPRLPPLEPKASIPGKSLLAVSLPRRLFSSLFS